MAIVNSNINICSTPVDTSYYETLPSGVSDSRDLFSNLNSNIYELAGNNAYATIFENDIMVITAAASKNGDRPSMAYIKFYAKVNNNLDYVWQIPVNNLRNCYLAMGYDETQQKGYYLAAGQFYYNGDWDNVQNSYYGILGGNQVNVVSRMYELISGSQITPIVLANGGGATHIAKRTGLLATLSEHVSDILIVAGGGGGGGLENTTPGNGGGYQGGNPKLNDTPISGRSGTQSTGNAFGKGQDSATFPGGGGGFYGGLAAQYGVAGAGAGSGYIGNSALFNKKMYGNNVPESSDAGTKTTSVTSKSSSAISNKPKIGDGYVKIKYLRAVEPVTDSYFFHPDFAVDCHDTVRYDPNTLVYFYDGSGIGGDEAVGVGTMHGEEMSSFEEPIPEWKIQDGKIINLSEWHNFSTWYAWCYGIEYESSTYSIQEIIPRNATLSMHVHLKHEYDEDLETLETNVIFYPYSNLSGNFSILSKTDENTFYGNFYDYVEDIDLDLNEDTMDIPNRYVPTMPSSIFTTGVDIEYKFYLSNGIVSKIEYYFNDELYQSFSNLTEYNITFWNLIGSGEDIRGIAAIILETHCREVSDFYIKIE